jgi:hypothetical protein
MIDLRVFSSVKSSEDQTHRANSFDVYSSDIRFSMVAPTENDKEDWIRHIGKAIVVCNHKSFQKDFNFDDQTEEQEQEVIEQDDDQ